MSWVHYHVLGTSTMSWVHFAKCIPRHQKCSPRHVSKICRRTCMSWVHRPCLGQQYDIVGTFSISWAHGLISWVHVLMSWVHLTYRGYISYDVVNTCHPRHKSCSPRHDHCSPRHVPKIWCTSNMSWVTI